MVDDLLGGLTVRHPVESDHARVLAVLGEWWGDFGGPAGATQRALLLSRLFFQHFTQTSWLAEDADSALRAFLVGLLSPSRPGVAYIHSSGSAPHCTAPAPAPPRGGFRPGRAAPAARG